MPRNPEQRPEYLQDVILPQEAEQAPEGFDLDREFGRGTKKEAAALLKSPMGIGDAVWASDYFILFGERIFSEEIENRVLQALENSLRPYLQSFHDAGYQKPANASLIARGVAAQKILSGRSTLTAKEEKMVEEILRERIERPPVEYGDFLIALAAAEYRAMFGKGFWSKEQNERMVAAFKKVVTKDRMRRMGIQAAKEFALLRILKAHDIKFIPGKGIEIIDTPPQFQQAPIPPMPEERKF